MSDNEGINIFPELEAINPMDTPKSPSYASTGSNSGSSQSSSGGSGFKSRDGRMHQQNSYQNNSGGRSYGGSSGGGNRSHVNKTRPSGGGDYGRRRGGSHHSGQSQPEVFDPSKIISADEVAAKTQDELLEMLTEMGVENASGQPVQEMVFRILREKSVQGYAIEAHGILEVMQDGFGFLRSPKTNYATKADDVYVSSQYIRNHGLKTGDNVSCYAREPKMRERYFALAKINSINDVEHSKSFRRPVPFDSLTPVYPREMLSLELPKGSVVSRSSNRGDSSGSSTDFSTRVIDLVCPIGKGQRALIVAPPRVGKTVLLQNIAHSINVNHPNVELIVLLIDERPEEVTDMARSVKGEVVASTFDEQYTRHVALSEIIAEKAKRMVEHGKDVVILLDSITRLARAYNNVLPSSGKVLTGGVDANALQAPKRFFGAARNIENGGSLTIIATALVDTGSRMDEVIFEEFKGTGNSEIILDRKIADKRIFPAIEILKSGTRREEEMIEHSTLVKMWILRRILSGMTSVEAVEFLLGKLQKTENNAEFFDTMKQQ